MALLALNYPGWGAVLVPVRSGWGVAWRGASLAGGSSSGAVCWMGVVAGARPPVLGSGVCTSREGVRSAWER